MHANTRIRPAVETDVDALSLLMRQTFADAYGHCSTPANVSAYMDAVYAPHLQKIEIADPGIVTLLVEADGERLIGFAQLRFSTSKPEVVTLRNPAELGRIYLQREAQGKGVAAELMSRVLQAAREHDVDGLWLSVWQDSPQAIAFYRKHGFEIAGPTLFVVGDDPKHDWLMQRALDPR